MFCRNCGCEIIDDCNFCSQCGARNISKKRDTMFCRNCGCNIPADSTYCYQCGIAIQTDTQSSCYTGESGIENVTDKEPKYSSIEKLKKYLSTRKTMFFVILACICLSLVVLLRSADVTVIEGISLGMTKDAVKRAENDSGREYEGAYIVLNKNFHDVSCGFTYFFDSENRLSSVSITTSENNYKIYLHLFDEFHNLYGDPKYVTEELNDRHPLQRIYWEFKDSHLCLMYMENRSTGDLTISMVYDDGFEEYTDIKEVVFHGKQTCSADGGCNDLALPWSDFCGLHSCNIIGCNNEYVYTYGMWDFPLCEVHFIDSIKGNIYVR